MHCNILLLACFCLTTSEIVALADNTSVSLYFGSGCFFARQHLFISEFEQKSLGREDADLTAIAGYAGSTQTGPKDSACYHNSQNFSDYGVLGDAEVVKVEVPLSALESAFAVYFGAFVEMDGGKWARPDYYDEGAEYRSLIGVPDGVGNKQVMQAMRKANAPNLTLQQGHGSDPDTLVTNTVYVMDSKKFAFIQAERCLQFRDDSIAKYPESYHQLIKGFETRGRVLKTTCPANYICGSTAKLSVEVSSIVV